MAFVPQSLTTYKPKEPANKTPQEIARLIWEIFQQNPMWGKERIAMTLWGLGVFVAASTVRNILRRPRPGRSSPEGAEVHNATGVAGRRRTAGPGALTDA